MNTQNTDSTNRPLGYWLKAADRLMAAEFAAAFQDEGLTRRDWRLLNAVDDGADRERRLPEHKLERLIERDWIARTDGGWALTDEGRAAKERLGAVVDGIRRKVADAVSPEDYATTLAALEQIARAYGWEEGMGLPRGRGHGFGPGRRAFGRGRRHGLGHGFAPREDAEHGRPFGPRHGFGPREGHASHGGSQGFGQPCDPRDGFGPHGRHGHPGAVRLHAARAAQHAYEHAYERGFDAGFDRGSHVR
ncbi:MarR family winged helix-turn-helix transcriptional regulator [Microbacterium tumbae]